MEGEAKRAWAPLGYSRAPQARRKGSFGEQTRMRIAQDSVAEVIEMLPGHLGSMERKLQEVWLMLDEIRRHQKTVEPPAWALPLEE